MWHYAKNGIFLRFDISEVPEKKKAALGVRGIKLSGDDMVDEVYLLAKNGETIITYNDKSISLNRLKLGHRDTKGTKLRI
jgi:DNA gyrase subunit A